MQSDVAAHSGCCRAPVSQDQFGWFRCSACGRILSLAPRSAEVRQDGLPARLHAEEAGETEAVASRSLLAAVHAANEIDAKDELQSRDQMLSELEVIARRYGSEP